MITYHSKNFENPNIAFIKSVLQNIRDVYIDYATKAKKVGSNSDIRISEVFINEKNVNLTKQQVLLHFLFLKVWQKLIMLTF